MGPLSATLFSFLFSAPLVEALEAASLRLCHVRLAGFLALPLDALAEPCGVVKGRVEAGLSDPYPPVITDEERRGERFHVERFGFSKFLRAAETRRAYLARVTSSAIW